MSLQASNKLIGGFVVSALALATAAVMVFGSGKLFERTIQYVLHFQGSVKGLNVGSPVLLKGVKVGTVQNVAVEYNPDELTVDIPVYIDLEAGRFEVTGGVPPKNLKQRREQMKRLVELGLRGQLQSQSMVTGQLVVALDFFPNSPVKLEESKGSVVEIPTIPSTIEQLADALKGIRLDDLAAKLSRALDGMAALTTAPELVAAIKDLREITSKTKRIVTALEKRAAPLADEVAGTVRDTHRLVNRIDEKVVSLSDSAQGLLDRTDTRLGTLAKSLSKAADTATEALQQANKALSDADTMVGKDSQFRHQVNKTLQELADAARAIRAWADYLERHPEALIQGKK